MPNHYKGLGLTPEICLDSPIVPYTGAAPPDGPMASQREFGKLRGLGDGQPPRHDVDHSTMYN